MSRWLSILTLALSLSACAADSDVPDVSDITAEQLLARMEAANPPIILDVRTAEEYQQGYVPGAINIPHDQIGSRLAELGEVRDRDVVVYCKSGGRASIAGAELSEAGFRVLHLQGDMTGWAAAGHPQQKPDADN